MTLAEAYDATGRAWEDGPGRVYNHLADVLVSLAPAPLGGRTVVDVGAGTGAASRAIRAVGGRPVAVDIASGMLAAAGRDRPPSVVGDAAGLPFGDARVDGAVAAFVLNHTRRPAGALAELRRVCRPGSPLIVSAYADDDDHPVKRVVDEALRAVGWMAPPWYEAVRHGAVPLLATVDRAAAVAREAGIEASVRRLAVAMPWLDLDDLIAWRLGMAHHTSFVAGLRSDMLDDVVRSARRDLGDAPPLVRSIIVITAIV